MSRRRQQTVEGTLTGDPQDALGVRERARSEGLVRNRRDPTWRPTSGEGGGYKPKVKCHRAGRESEGLIVLMMAPTITASEGRSPALVTPVNRGKCEGMPARANSPVVKAREPGSGLSVAAKRLAVELLSIVPDGPSRVTASMLMASRSDSPWRACAPGRSSVSRVREIRTHGLKGGFRSPGPQGHRA
jgi:hypothetical protein